MGLFTLTMMATSLYDTFARALVASTAAAITVVTYVDVGYRIWRIEIHAICQMGVAEVYTRATEEKWLF